MVALRAMWRSLVRRAVIVVRKLESGSAPIDVLGPIGQIGVRVTQAFVAQEIWTYRVNRAVSVVPANGHAYVPRRVHGLRGGTGEPVAGRAFVALEP